MGVGSGWRGVDVGVFVVLFFRDKPGVLVVERMEDALDADVG